MKTLKLLLILSLSSFPLAACEEDDGGGTTGADMPSGPGTDEPGDDGDPPGAGSNEGNDNGGNQGGNQGSAGDGAEPEPMGPADIVDTAIAAGSFTSLAQALTTAGLVDALKGEGPFTVFAPTDDAFAAFEAENPGVLEALGVDELTEILTYHVISGAAVRSSELQNGQLVATLGGPVVAVDLSGDAPQINDASVVTADIEADNGVIHVIDRILLPPGDIIDVAVAAGQFSNLAGALTSAGLVDTLKGEGPFTVFAPTDAAFEALSAVPEGEALIDVLTYHVLPGIAGPLDLQNGAVARMVNGAPVLFDLSDGVKINGANITLTNVVAKNGVIHVIDAVIVPPSEDIVDTAIAAGNFTSLAGALTSAGLVDTLRGEGPFTVFAPTDEAFAALSAVPEGDALEQVLLYHVAPGLLGSGNLRAGSVETASGDSVTIALDNGVRVDEAQVVTANILCRNGVIHVVDRVLVP